MNASRSDQPHNSRLSAVNLVVVGQIPKCPTCGVALGYSRINIINPFPCPHCGRQLMVPKAYFKRLRFFCAVLAIGVAVTVCCRYWASAPKTDASVWHAYLLLLLTFGVTSLVAGGLGSIFAKRIFPPTLEDTFPSMPPERQSISRPRVTAGTNGSRFASALNFIPTRRSKRRRQHFNLSIASKISMAGCLSLRFVRHIFWKRKSNSFTVLTFCDFAAFHVDYGPSTVICNRQGKAFVIVRFP